jgi:tetratricopeptide (TPR) repeat protein
MSRKPRGGRQLQKFWDGCLWYLGMPARAWRQTTDFLTRGLRRRLRRSWQSAPSFFLKPFAALAKLPRRTLRFFSGWWRSRSFRNLLQGLPALTLGSAAVVLAIFLKLTPESQAVDSYLREAHRLFQAKDYDAAQICYERLALLNPDKPEYRFWMATTCALMGQHDRAAAILDKLAPSDKQGYAPAHVWQARRLMSIPNTPQQAIQAAELHLLRALQSDPERLEANVLLGNLYFATRRLDQAEAYLLKGVHAQPELRFVLARVHQIRGNKDEMRKQAEIAVQAFRARSKANVDSHQDRLYWAEAVMLTEDFPGAVKILEEGLLLAPNQPYGRVLAHVHISWADSLGEDPQARTGERLALLEKAMRYDVNNPTLAQRLLALTKVKGEEADQARKALQKLLAEGKSPATVHLLLGMDAWEQGKKEEARQHLEQAYKLSPQAALVANSLAWTLAQADPPDLERALELANSAVLGWPGQLRVRDTRGHVLAKMGRWKEALADLEAALPAVSNKRESHRVLAEVYKGLGNAEMAAEHQRLADKAP